MAFSMKDGTNEELRKMVVGEPFATVFMVVGEPFATVYISGRRK